MMDLRRTRRKLSIVLVCLAAVDVLAVAVLFSPLVGSTQSRLAELDQLRTQAQRKMREVEPLHGLDKKVVTASQQIDSFYKTRLPDRDSVIFESLGKMASESGVQLTQVSNSPDKDEEFGLRPLVIDANLSGGYLQLVRFINSLERDQLFFVVDGVDLGGEQGDTVRLHLKLRTFLKTSS
ncbi:MAG TPA: GspMb/PilO family protein [Terriglobales bacterium]|nr:GspMb/PilO family protein [Terriglobales bacterium]